VNITSDDAAVVYARACWVWYGPKAARVVRTRIEELRRVGDRAGVPQVAEKLPQLIERPISGSVGQRHRYEAPQTVAGGEKLGLPDVGPFGVAAPGVPAHHLPPSLWISLPTSFVGLEPRNHLVRPFDGVPIAIRPLEQFFRHEHVPHGDLPIDFSDKMWARAFG
jgi:hypothetical protein